MTDWCFGTFFLIIFPPKNGKKIIPDFLCFRSWQVNHPPDDDGIPLDPQISRWTMAGHAWSLWTLPLVVVWACSAEGAHVIDPGARDMICGYIYIIYIIYIWICGISWYIWRFPKSWGYPSHHPVVMVIHDDSYWNWSCLGIPHDLRTPQKRVCRCVWKQGIPLKWLFE